MFVLRRLLLAICALALLSAPAALADDGASASKSKKCKHGYKLKTVTKHGKKVKVCGKAKAKGKGKPKPTQPGNDTPAAGPTGLFEAPGKKLEGQAAVPFLQKYLANSTFTDCPARWPNCAVEQRYSHTNSGSFYYCRLTSVSGADIINGARAYQVQNAVVEPDGSWTFNEQVENSGGPSFYEWHVSTAGVVNGAYQFAGNPIEQIGPLQYVAGARDCSY